MALDGFSALVRKSKVSACFAAGLTLLLGRKTRIALARRQHFPAGPYDPEIGWLRSAKPQRGFERVRKSKR